MATNYGKFGVDANQPIDYLGNIAPRLQNPDFIANSGAHWLRVNFVLPNPAYINRYDEIVDRYIAKGMKIYASVGHDATGDFWLGDKLRDPNSPHAQVWIDRYALRFREIVTRYTGKIFVYEALNEPNGWQGGDRALIHPKWWVILMETLYRELKPRQRGIRLISGPLEATWLNGNEAASYLTAVYQLGNWAPGSVPWDGLGYHLYVGEDPASPSGSPGSIDEADIKSYYSAYISRIWGIMNYYDPNTKNLIFISEFGWTSDLGEDYQAKQNALGMSLLANDDRVAFASLFCTEDFGKLYGLYTKGMGRPKTAFHNFRQLMETRAPQRTSTVHLNSLEGPIDVPIITGPGGSGESLPWSVGPGLMRHPVEKRYVILLPPFDDGSWGRAAIEAGYHGQGGATLAWSPGEAGLTIAGEERVVLVVNPAEWGTPDASMVPWFHVNTPGVKVKEETFRDPAAFTDWLRVMPNPFAGAQG